jgi:addiction module RelB/DinJ family antitoxin
MLKTVSKTSNVHARISPILKAKATKVLDDLGISLTQFIELNLNQIVKDKDVKMELKLLKNDDEDSYITIFDAKRDNKGKGVEINELLGILKKINGSNRKVFSKNK